jgi:protein TonB
MFTNLIESDSHRKEFKRRTSFFLVTIATYGLLLFAAGIASIYAYDARLEAQSNDLTVLSWIPPVTPAPASRPRTAEPTRRLAVRSNAPVDPHLAVPMRTVPVAPVTDPTKAPDTIGTAAPTIPPVRGPVVIGLRNADPPGLPTGDSGICVSCNGTSRVVPVETTPPPVPTPVKPQTQRLTSVMLIAKAISIPKPPYPPMAKAIGAQGSVAVQILVDEQGKVISAQPVSGHPTLVAAAKQAAFQARFTPTILNGQPVKIQGVITYNFVMQ